MKPIVTVQVFKRLTPEQLKWWGDEPIPYTNWDISVDCNTETNSWFLHCESHKDGSVKDYPCADFYDALHRFKHNCAYYCIDCPTLPRTEDEYFGAAPGRIIPQSVAVASASFSAGQGHVSNHTSGHEIVPQAGHTSGHEIVNALLSGGAIWPTSL